MTLNEAQTQVKQTFTSEYTENTLEQGNKYVGIFFQGKGEYAIFHEQDGNLNFYDREGKRTNPLTYAI